MRPTIISSPQRQRVEIRCNGLKPRCLVMRCGLLRMLILLLLMLTACNLGDNTTTDAPTTVPTTTIVPQTNTTLPETPGYSDDGNNTEFPETPNDSDEGDGTDNGDCTVREDWPLYEVTRGDTLTGIARRTDSTIDELIEANCLENPDRLTAGHMLHVPHLPE